MLCAPITPDTRWPEQNVLWPPPPQQCTRRGIHGWAAELRGRRHGLSLKLEQPSLFEEWYFVNDSGADARFESLWDSQCRRKLPRWLRLWSCSCQYEGPHGFRMAGWLTAVLKLLHSWNSTSSMSYLELAKRASINQGPLGIGTFKHAQPEMSWDALRPLFSNIPWRGGRTERPRSTNIPRLEPIACCRPFLASIYLRMLH